MVYFRFQLSKIRIASKTIRVNGEYKQIDTAPVIVNDRTLVPLRFVVESMNFPIQWNAAKKNVEIDISSADQ